MHVRLHHISKSFGAVAANQDVTLDIEEGEVLALLGENGAGKSTLMKILYGVYAADSGQIVLDGQDTVIASPRTAMALGIGMVFQQFSLVPALTVAENLMLAYPQAPWWQGRKQSAWNDVLTRLRALAPEIDPQQTAGSLAVGEQQLVELTKVLNLEAKFIILDEPTSVLTPLETQRLYARVRELAASGHSVVLITHKFEDVLACADRVAVMRGGKLVETLPAAGLTTDQLATLVMGREVHAPPARTASPAGGRARLQVKNVSATDSITTVDGFNLEIAAGEIFGLAGVAGNGQSVLADAIAGAIALTEGEVSLDGEVLNRPGRRPRPDARVGYIPEQPLENAVAGDLDLIANMALTRVASLPFWLPRREEAAQTAVLMEKFDVRPRDPKRLARQLSGGNLQKLVIARELGKPCALVIACYPTMGLDIAASQAIREQLFRQAEAGAAVLWISEELDELLEHAHRVGVLFRGRLAGVTDTVTADRNEIGRWMGTGQ